MNLFGKKGLYSGKVVVIGQSGCIRATSGYFWIERLYSGKSGSIRTKVVVFGKKGM